MRVVLIQYSHDSRLRDMLGRVPDIEVVIQTENAEEAPNLCAEYSPSLLMVDAFSGDAGTLEFIPKVKKDFPDTKVFVLTGQNDDAMALKARKAGADIVARENICLEGLIQLIHYSQKNYRIYPASRN